MKPLRMDVRLRNNVLVRLREDLGLSARQMAIVGGVSYATYLDFESLKLSPLYADSRINRCIGHVGWKPSALSIAAFHGIGPDELWPAVVLAVVKRTASIELDGNDLARIAGVSRSRLLPPDERVADAQRESTLRSAMSVVLTPREEMVVRARFGFGGGGGLSLDEMAATMSQGAGHLVSRERVRQIEGRALRKLRYRPVAKRLADL